MTSTFGLTAQYTTVHGLRPGELHDGEPVDTFTIVLDDLDGVVYVAGSPDQLENLARNVRREVDAIRTTCGDTAGAAVRVQVDADDGDAGDGSEGTLPSTLDYIAVDPDARLRIVSAVISVGGKLPILQAAVGGYIELVQTTDDVDCFANEEGLLLGLPYNRIGGLVHQRLTGTDRALDLVGTIVLVATNGDDAISLTAAQRRRIVEAWTAADRGRYLH